MKNLMSEELLKQLLNKIASLESRVQFLELTQSGVNGNPDPSYWQRAMTEQISNIQGVPVKTGTIHVDEYKKCPSFCICNSCDTSHGQ